MTRYAPFQLKVKISTLAAESRIIRNYIKKNAQKLSRLKQKYPEKFMQDILHNPNLSSEDERKVENIRISMTCCEDNIGTLQQNRKIMIGREARLTTLTLAYIHGRKYAEAEEIVRQGNELRVSDVQKIAQMLYRYQYRLRTKIKRVPSRLEWEDRIAAWVDEKYFSALESGKNGDEKGNYLTMTRRLSQIRLRDRMTSPSLGGDNSHIKTAA